MQQGIEQRATVISMTGMNNHARDFIDHYQGIIFIDDIKGNVLSYE